MDKTATDKTALVIAPTASMGVPLCRLLAQDGYNFILSGRNQEELESLGSDLSIRFGVQTRAVPLDLAQPFSTDDFMKEVGDFDSVIMVAGDLGNGDKDDLENVERVLRVNLNGPAQILTAAASMMARKGEGEIMVISSVGGDRGIQRSYPYGASKAGLTALASGLRSYLYPKGVYVMTVKPGYVDTPMTYGLENPWLAARPEPVAVSIVRAMKKKKDVIYVPFFWTFIMFIIKHLPESTFKKSGQ